MMRRNKRRARRRGKKARQRKNVVGIGKTQPEERQDEFKNPKVIITHKQLLFFFLFFLLLSIIFKQYQTSKSAVILKISMALIRPYINYCFKVWGQEDFFFISIKEINTFI